jgi:hypothetical protein
MDKVFTTLTVINRADQILASRGMIPAEEVRSITLRNVLVDTGATTLCLPEDVIATLGLELLKFSQTAYSELSKTNSRKLNSRSARKASLIGIGASTIKSVSIETI